MNRKILFAAAAMTLLTACNQEEIATDPAAGRVPVTLSYTTVDATETRAATNLNQGTFASGEAIKVRISNTSENYWTDYDFTTGEAGAMNATDPAPYYPAGPQNIDILAYYPTTAGTTFTVALDQTTDAAYKASDLMVATITNQAKTTNAVNLAFSHMMAKLIVNVTAGSGVSKINSVSILNVKPTVTFDPSLGSVGIASGEATTIAISNNGAAVIPAQSITGRLLSIVTDKGTAIYSVPSGKEFQAGHLYTLNITVNLYAVGATNAITNWTTDDNSSSPETTEVFPLMPDKSPTGVVAVDLGNPDGVKWANMNVGAASETDYGDYFIWGATEPFYQPGYAQVHPCTQWIEGKTGYNWDSYPFMKQDAPTWSNITKYTVADKQYEGIWYSGETFIGDGKTSFADYNYVDDAARQNWGGYWRTPSPADWAWLKDHCTWTWTDNYNSSGKAGYLVTSKVPGYTSNSIFLPAAGKRFEVFFESSNTEGNYWSSSIHDSDFANYFCFGSDHIVFSFYQRYFGLSVRAVYDPHE